MNGAINGRISILFAAMAMLGAVGLVGCLIGAVLEPEAFFRGYLVAYVYWFGVAMGTLVILMTHHLTGGRWGLLIRRIVEAGSRTLLLLAILFIPILVGLEDLYLWARPEEVQHSEILQHKEPYLNVLGFTFRAAVYFLIWLTLSWLLGRWSRQHDETGDPRLLSRMRTLSGPGLVLYGLTITFASTDWIMSLEPEWYSTIYPFIFAGLEFQLGLAFSILMLTLFAKRPPLEAMVRPQQFRDLGNLLLAMVMFLAYVAFSQFMLIWIANLPEEIIWYRSRLESGWQWLAWSLVIGQFAIPFLFLLFRRVKQNRRSLAAVAGWVLLMCLVNFFWQVVPAFTPDSVGGHGLDILASASAMLGIGGIWMAVFLMQLRKVAIVPPHDPILAEMGSHD